MRTELSSIGKEEVLRRLFENTEYTNGRTIAPEEKGRWCTSHKIMLEGVDFDLVYNPLKHLGYKAALNAMGEIYAAFYEPVSLSVSLGISSRFCYEDIQQLWEGMLAAAKEHELKNLSLDLNPSLNGLCISLASAGVQKKSALEARPASANMDLICLSGRLGAAYMGMHVLEREKAAFNKDGRQPDLSKYKTILASYLSPEVKADTVRRFIDTKLYPAKGYFITRGLGDAVIRLTRESGFGAKIYLEKIPLSTATFDMAAEIDMDPVTAAMNGGDDYQFIFTIPISQGETFRREFRDYDIIGHLAQSDVGAVMVTPEGVEIPVRAQGYSAEE